MLINKRRLDNCKKITMPFLDQEFISLQNYQLKFTWYSGYLGKQILELHTSVKIKLHVSRQNKVQYL